MDIWGSADTIHFGTQKSKECLLRNFNKTIDYLLKNNNSTIQFNNADFRVFLNEFSFRHRGKDKRDSFIYCDPPNLGTNNNYSDSFKEQDFYDLVKTCIDSGIKFAISEFDNPIVKQIATENNLNIIPICERRTLKNRNIEILITNYVTNNELFGV